MDIIIKYRNKCIFHTVIQDDLYRLNIIIILWQSFVQTSLLVLPNNCMQCLFNGLFGWSNSNHEHTIHVDKSPAAHYFWCLGRPQPIIWITLVGSFFCGQLNIIQRDPVLVLVISKNIFRSIGRVGVQFEKDLKLNFTREYHQIQISEDHWSVEVSIVELI